MFFCFHKWETIGEYDFLSKRIYEQELRRTGKVFVLRCKKCGTIKEKIIKV